MVQDFLDGGAANQAMPKRMHQNQRDGARVLMPGVIQRIQIILQLLVPDVLDAFRIFKRHAGFQILPRGGTIAVEHQTDMAILDVLTAHV